MQTSLIGSSSRGFIRRVLAEFVFGSRFPVLAGIQRAIADPVDKRFVLTRAGCATCALPRVVRA